MNSLYFQYCPKLIVLNESLNSVLLAKRMGEQDFDGIYSFIGGKLETTDQGIIAGITREKNEEIGSKAKLQIAEMPVYTVYFQKKDGSSMILPHHICKYLQGDIELSEEYSQYQ